MKKKILTMILSVLMILTVVPAVVSAMPYSIIVNYTKETFSGTDTDGTHFNVTYDYSSGSGWQLSSGKTITISSRKSGEYIKKINFSVALVQDATKGTNNLSATSGTFVEDSGIANGDTITLNLPDNTTNVTISWTEGTAYIEIDSAEIIYAPITVADVLEAADSFPSTYASGWINTDFNSKRIYLESDTLKVSDGNGNVAELPTVTEGAWANEYQFKAAYDDGFFLFNLTDDKLTNITYHNDDEKSSLNGSYVPGYTITVDVVDDYMGSASADTSIALNGTTISLSAIPNNGYRFVKWISDDVTVDGDDKFTMPSYNVEVKALFEPIPIDEVNFTHGTFDFDKLTIEAPMTPDGARYALDDEIPYILCLLKKKDRSGYDSVAYSGPDGIWKDDSTGQKIDDPSKIEFDAASLIVDIETNSRFSPDVVVKANGKALTKLTEDEWLGLGQGEIEGYIIEPEESQFIEACVIFQKPGPAPRPVPTPTTYDIPKTGVE